MSSTVFSNMTWIALTVSPWDAPAWAVVALLDPVSAVVAPPGSERNGRIHRIAARLAASVASLARDAGCLISIGTDAHSQAELRQIEFGLAAAARAGIPRQRILNFRPVGEVTEWRRTRRPTP